MGTINLTSESTAAVLFLDLEQTVIESWNCAILMNIGRVRDFIAQLKPSECHLFSFAIDTEHDERIAREHLVPTLERALAIKLGPVQSKRRIFAAAGVAGGMSWAKQHDKNVTFPLWVEATQAPLAQRRRYILLDDDVKDAVLERPALNATIELVNVARIGR